jgi:hypothetical protein
MSFDGEKLGAEFAAATRAYVERQLAPVLARLDRLEKEARSLRRLAAQQKDKS